MGESRYLSDAGRSSSFILNSRGTDVYQYQLPFGADLSFEGSTLSAQALLVEIQKRNRSNTAWLGIVSGDYLILPRNS